ncbi:hypothetical protein COB55_03025 [Candidatus Wolfebacteria bacterium]|nr:MAG: hypothetical protein COB55_03025 [Candidatus Wolfebacteria bacterium]
MNWKKIDPDNLPYDVEVLFRYPDGNWVSGIIWLNAHSISSADGLIYFNDVTHYFDPAELKMPSLGNIRNKFECKHKNGYWNSREVTNENKLIEFCNDCGDERC